MMEWHAVEMLSGWCIRQEGRKRRITSGMSQATAEQIVREHRWIERLRATIRSGGVLKSEPIWGHLSDILEEIRLAE